MGKFLDKGPAWFKLHNYDKYLKYDLGKWIEELETRLNLVSYLKSPKDSHIYQKSIPIIDQIMKTGSAIVPNESDLDTIVELLKDYSAPLSGSYKPETKHVSSLSQYSAYNLCLLAKNRDDFFKDYQGIKLNDGEPNPINKRKEFKRKYSFPIHQQLIIGNKKYIQVDSTVSDEQLVEDFKEWLSVIRKREQIKSPPKKTKRSKLIDWHEFRVIPFFDLMVVSLVNEVEMSNALLAEVLFPDSYDVDTEERVRKVVKKKAREAIKLSTINDLKAQLRSELI